MTCLHLHIRGPIVDLRYIPFVRIQTVGILSGVDGLIPLVLDLSPFCFLKASFRPSHPN